MKKAVISGDIVASTSLTDEGRSHIEEELKKLLDELHEKFKIVWEDDQG